MQAFAKDSANNVIGGSGPVNKNIDFAQFHGRGAEGFTDYSTSAANGAAPLGEPINFEPYAGSSAPVRAGARPGVDRTSSFNATARVDQIHGETTMGLGTSTFLEGAPAARTAIQRRESDSENTSQLPIGLGRKTSLAQKIRSIKSSAGDRGNRHPGGRVRSPENMDYRPTSPPSPGREIQSAGGMPKIAESTPFFNEYDDAYDQKTKNIQAQQQLQSRNRSDSFGNGEEQISTGAVRSRAMSSPKRGPPPAALERRITNDGGVGGIGNGGAGESVGGGGFLNRVKSLKGGKRSRPDRAL